MNTTICEMCGLEYGIGAWPLCPHGIPRGHLHDFRAYTDFNISDKPVEITSLAQKQRLLRPHWKDDYVVHVQPRDKPDSYYRELNDRRAERAEQERKERRSRIIANSNIAD